jgi:hypothetical protein
MEEHLLSTKTDGGSHTIHDFMRTPLNEHKVAKNRVEPDLEIKRNSLPSRLYLDTGTLPLNRL